MSVFNSLPPEILQRIASLTTAETALSLILCNKNLYSAIYDPFVFRGIISNSNGYSFQPEHSWNVSFLPATTPVSVLIRYAVADSKARSWRYLPRLGYNEVLNICTAAHFEWAPHLAALGHPFVRELDLQAYISTLCALTPSEAQLGKLKYVLHGALLAHETHEFLRDSLMPSEVASLVTNDFATPEQLNLILSLAMWQARTDQRDWVTPLPKYEKMSFITMVSDPVVPFVSHDDLDACYAKTIAGKEFLEDGEWEGYYSFDIHLTNEPYYDPPMKGIRFRVGNVTLCNNAVDDARASTSSRSTLHVSANGSDHVGSFDLSGQIYSDGRVSLQKDYNQGPTWHWDAKMTPWGLMGFWGGEEGDRFGYVWLWKKEWST